MAEGPYRPEDDDVLVHRHSDDQEDAYFSLGTGYGAGKPHFYVCLDENGGEHSWWLDPEQAQSLGTRLLEYGTDCRARNEEEDRRIARSKLHDRDEE